MQASKKSVTPKKQQTASSFWNPTQLIKTCQRILNKDSAQQVQKYFQQNKITSLTLKNDKCLHILHISKQILNAMLIDGHINNVDHQMIAEQFLMRIIEAHKKNEKKVIQFCKCLKYFAEKDYEFQFLRDIGRGFGEGVGFYLRCRDVLIDSFLNKSKKELLSTITAQTQQWYKLVQKIFKNMQKQHLVQLFTDIIKHHYLSIKKNQNQLLNGAQIFRICQIMNRNIMQSNNHLYSFDQKEEVQANRSMFGVEDAGRESRVNREKEVKRLFQKNVVEGLQAQDRQLIRILSYKDNNIARLLQQKHQKMIELIAEDVQRMRNSIEQQKNKYIDLWSQKEQILRDVENLNNSSLKYIENNNVENEEKLFEGILGFCAKYRPNGQVKADIERLRGMKKNMRLIEMIEKEEREKDK